MMLALFGGDQTPDCSHDIDVFNLQRTSVERRWINSFIHELREVRKYCKRKKPRQVIINLFTISIPQRLNNAERIGLCPSVAWSWCSLYPREHSLQISMANVEMVKEWEDDERRSIRITLNSWNSLNFKHTRSLGYTRTDSISLFREYCCRMYGRMTKLYRSPKFTVVIDMSRSSLSPIASWLVFSLPSPSVT